MGTIRREREREISGYTGKKKNIFAIYRADEKFRNDITCIDRGLAKPKKARMQNDFHSEDKLPTEGGTKKKRFR